MTRTDDETFVSFLREQTLSTLPAPGLDPSNVLAASRRKRTVMRAARASAALVVAALAVVGVADLVDLRDGSAPPVDQVPDPSESAILIGLAEGITAVNRPVEITLADGSPALNLGLDDSWPGGDRVVLSTGSADGTAAANGDAGTPGTGVGLWVASADELLGQVTTLSWLPGDSAQDYLGGAYPAPTKVQHPYTGQTMIIGAVPAWISDATVTLHLATEVTLADGTRSRSVEVPTFTAPTEDARLLFLISLDATVGVSDGEGFAVTVADSEGHTVIGGCPDGDLQACIASAAHPVTTDTGTTMCAEFPAAPPSGPQYEGWWSSSPAAADGSILTDPADWPPIMREHPQTAMIDTRTGKVLVTYDRYACGPVADYAVPAGLELPPDAVVVVDAATGQILETMSPPAFEPQW